MLCDDACVLQSSLVEESGAIEKERGDMSREKEAIQRERREREGERAQQAETDAERSNELASQTACDRGQALRGQMEETALSEVKNDVTTVPLQSHHEQSVTWEIDDDNASRRGFAYLPDKLFERGANARKSNPQIERIEEISPKQEELLQPRKHMFRDGESQGIPETAPAPFLAKKFSAAVSENARLRSQLQQALEETDTYRSKCLVFEAQHKRFSRQITDMSAVEINLIPQMPSKSFAGRSRVASIMSKSKIAPLSGDARIIEEVQEDKYEDAEEGTRVRVLQRREEDQGTGADVAAESRRRFGEGFFEGAPAESTDILQVDRSNIERTWALYTGELPVSGAAALAARETTLSRMYRDIFDDPDHLD